jgi:hypothetical protein
VTDLNETNQLLVYAEDINSFYENTHTIKENKETLLDTGTEVDL